MNKIRKGDDVIVITGKDKASAVSCWPLGKIV
jgi:ribosomal protein L24